MKSEMLTSLFAYKKLVPGKIFHFGGSGKPDHALYADGFL